MKVIFWVKWSDSRPEKWYAESFDEFWHRIRDATLQNSRRLEWIVYD